MRQAAFSAPSAIAADVGMALLEDGASAIEAMVAAAAAISVSYPHMNSIGGDGFWMILPAEGRPVGILAGGFSGASVGPHCWQNGQAYRGVGAMLTVPGAVAGWQSALDFQREQGRSPRPLQELLGPAITLARSGCTVARSLADTLAEKHTELRDMPGFAGMFLGNGLPGAGDVLAIPELGDLLDQLANRGLDDFYRGDVARHFSDGLCALGAHLTGDDLASYRAARVEPLSIMLDGDIVFNLPAPTQGLASLLILGVHDCLRSRTRGAADAGGIRVAHAAAWALPFSPAFDASLSTPASARLTRAAEPGDAPPTRPPCSPCSSW